MPPERRGAARPTIVGVGCLAVGALALFGSLVGYVLANGNLSAGDRLSEADAFGLPATAVGAVGLVLVVIGLVLLGVGIGTARRRDGDERPHPLP